VISSSTASTRELRATLALGARRGDLVRLLVSEAAALGVAGAVCGLLLARLALVTAVVVAVAVVAQLVPARRAVRLDPGAVLRRG
jgi:ABC-type lipoprotein release transport system permease subunit